MGDSFAIMSVYTNTGTISIIYIMNKINEYISEQNIIQYLCKVRAKLAKNRNRSHLLKELTSSEEYNYHGRLRKNEIEKILPPRRRWKRIGQSVRYKNGQPLNTLQKNMISLEKTIRYDMENYSNETYIIKLQEFIRKLQENCIRGNHKISSPGIWPKLKNDITKSENPCRPIATYNLMDRIILSLINKYFTDIFDEYFLPSSFAFRAPRQLNGRKYSLTHHDAFNEIIEYNNRFKGKPIFIAECDIMKFYDSVNHTIIKNYFKRLINRVKINKQSSYSEAAERLFYSFLDSYTFKKNVLIHNSNKKHFEKYQITNGVYKWVDKELISSCHYKSINNAKIGIPQGGALSGLIANIVLDYADKQIQEIADSDLLYIRYCDDMIIMHPNKKKCEEALKVYQNALRKLKLIPHPIKHKVEYGPKHWEQKSKEIYRWDYKNNNGIPWIGFVGYELHKDGSIRVRKSSIKKEMKKQLDVSIEAYNAIKDNSHRVHKKTIEESVINRLIGMSVGRVQLWNYKSIKSELCWVKGFKLINDNKYSRVQMKQLDRRRGKIIKRLKKKLNSLNDKKIKGNKGSRQRLYYGKPFSYYFHMIEK